jgi:hypothetical protein
VFKQADTQPYTLFNVQSDELKKKREREREKTRRWKYTTTDDKICALFLLLSRAD